MFDLHLSLIYVVDFSLLAQVMNRMIFLVNSVTLEQHWMNVYLHSISELLTAPGLSNFGWQ